MKASTILLVLTMLFSFGLAEAQETKPKQSPPDSSSVTTDDGVTIAINYGSPSLKGRQLGVDIAEVGKVWRAGANEATTVSFDKDVTVEGKALPAGKYSLHAIPGEQQTTFIFNKVWKKWGTEYDEAQDALRVDVDNEQTSDSVERLKITVDKSGKIHLAWGNYGLSMNVKAAK